MSNETLFYVLGIALVVAALAVSAVGLKFENFPTSRAQLFGVLATFAVLVVATATFAVRNAQDEQAAKAAEAAETPTEQTTSTEATTTQETTSTAETTTQETTSTSEAGGGGGSTVMISADPSGQLAFEQDSVSAKAGKVTIDFTNESPVGHDVKVEDADGNELGGTDVVTGDSATADVDLDAGTYTFYCDVPGHEEAGMKGTLTVK